MLSPEETQGPSTPQTIAFAMICFGRDDKVGEIETSPLKPKAGLNGPPVINPTLPLTPFPAFCRITGTSSLSNSLGRGPEFHAEWLRDEPYDATATDPGSYIPGAWCQLSPGNREHGIRNARCIFCIRFPIASFPFFLEKEAVSFWAAFSRLVPSYSLVRKRAERANSQFRTEREIDRAARSGPSRDKKRLAQDGN
jgi:hypothetical protein